MTLNGSNPFADALPEPDLTYYLALRAGYEAARTQFSTWQQALLTFQAAVARAHGLPPETQIDERGVIHRAPAASEPPLPAPAEINP